MKTRDGRLVSARFVDKEATMIRAEFKNYDTGEVNIQMYSFNPENKFVKQILEVFPPEELEKNYVEFWKQEDIRRRYFDRFVERFDEIIEYLDSGTVPSDVSEEDTKVTLPRIQALGNNPEEFFKLKLEIFELPEVRQSKNRAWKAKMRKATTSLELLALLYEVYSTLENEEGERLD